MDRMGGKMLYGDLSAQILEACFEVHNELGAGFLEAVYHKALLMVLCEKGIGAEGPVPLPVRFRGQVVGDYFADIVVEGKIVLELKAVQALAPEHQAQLINYLKATGIEVGLLINFGTPRLEYKRAYKP